jgi:RNA polymerase sigma factor (sigma-70 family)
MDDELATLLARDLDGAFERLVREHQHRIYTIALRVTRDGSDAEEVAQDAFLRAYRALASYAPERVRELRLRPWLAAIAVNLARNRLRRQRLRLTDIEALGPAELAAADAETPHADFARRQSTAHWQRLLAGLPDRYRVPLILRHIDELTYPEMTEVLGLPLGTLKAQVHRGLQLLRAAHDAAEREELTA